VWLWAIGAVLFGLFMARYGQAIGLGMEAVARGISRLLSPRIEPVFMPRIGVRFIFPRLKAYPAPYAVTREDYRKNQVIQQKQIQKFPEWEIELIRERRLLEQQR